MHDDFDCDDIHMEIGNLVEDSGQVVNSILLPSQPSASKSIAMPNDFDEKIEIAWQVLKVQLIFKKKTWVFHYRFFSNNIFLW
jgi:hypothetical protein